LQEFRRATEQLGAKPVHQDRLLRAWLSGQGLAVRGDARDLPYPRALIAGLPGLEAQLEDLLRAVSEHKGSDGSLRLLGRLADGQTIESVLLLREGVCVSTQVGCGVGCPFCMTGRFGLQRQLSVGEILAQVVHGRRRRTLRKVVFMGMGEPSHNLDAVLEAISILGMAGRFPHKNLVFSTVADRRIFERLARHDVKPAIAISLHTTKAELRAQLVPRAARMDPAELVELADGYARGTGYPALYQWTLLAGVNDGDDELERLAELMRGRYGIVNFIPYNEVEGAGFQRPSWDRAREMSRHLHARGVLAKLRRSAGQDVEGACGQLRSRSLAEPDPALAAPITAR
jgi:23S rRNA (adenine2503-C2)-methyltransferase